MIHKLILSIVLLDVFVLIVTLSGFIYTIYNIRKKKFRLIARDYGLLGMYFTFLLFTLLSFVVEWSLFFHIHDDITLSILYWMLAKRVSHALFTGLAITWSSGYKFGGTQPSGI